MGLNDQKGLTLTETVVGIALLALVWIGVMNIIILGKASESRARHKIQAIYVAQQKIEDIRRQTFSSIANSTSTVIIDDKGTPYTYSDDFNGTQTVTVTTPNTYYKKVIVDISWREPTPGSGRTVTMHEYCGTHIANDPQAN